MAGVVRAVDAVNAYTGLGVCCVNHLTAANVDCYVTNLACRGVGEEDQIACLQLGLGNLLGAGVLSSGVTRDGLAKVCVYILSKAGAVEASRRRTAVNIGSSEVLLCGCDYLICDGAACAELYIVCAHVAAQSVIADSISARRPRVLLRQRRSHRACRHVHRR